MSEEVIRSLEEGPDHQPDWRNRVVAIYLADIAKAPDGKSRLTEILFTEKDPFVRQFLRFRYDGVCSNAAGFRYAAGCQARNAARGPASMIRSMLVADRTPTEIAAELGTTRLNIVTFMKVFFDVRRYLGNDVWLRGIVMAGPPDGVGETEALRERRWLTAAYSRGWEGVEQVVFGRIPSTIESIESTSRQLAANLGVRALEYVGDLQARGEAPNENDLRRFLAARNVEARQPPRETGKDDGYLKFVTALHDTMVAKAEQTGDPELAGFLAGRNSDGVHHEEPPQRLRRRFAAA